MEQHYPLFYTFHFYFFGVVAIATFAAVTAFVTRDRTISLRCHRDCIYRARLVRLPLAAPTVVRSGRALAGKRLQITLGRRVSPGWYQLSVSLVHPTRPGKPLVRTSAPFAVRGSSQPRL